MQYLDFEIEIAHGDRVDYPLAVIHSPAGETRATFTLPFSQIELENRILTLKNVLLRSGGQHRRALTPDEQTVRTFGQDLFDALFTDDVGSLYHESRRQAERQDAGLRIKLRIQSPELSALPWEFLFDRRGDEFVCLSTSTPLVRYLETSVPVRPLAVKPPLRVLGMVVSPNDLEPLDVETERQRLDRALAPLQERGLVHLHWLEGGTWRDLQRCLRQEQWHIFHFVGHGAYDAQRDEGIVAFADRDGNSRHLTATELARLLTDHSTLRLALLNSCEGARAGELDLLSSTAATLVRRGLPAVLAMQYDITDRAAIQLSESFYEALADGLPVDAALAEARKAISLGVANSLEWGTPALFMRSGDGRIFDIDPSEMAGGSIAAVGLAATAGMAEQGRASLTPDEGSDGTDDNLSESTATAGALEQTRVTSQASVEEPSTKKKASRRNASALLIFAAVLAIAAGFVAWRFLPFDGIGTPTMTVVPTEGVAADDVEPQPAVVAMATSTGTATQTPTRPFTYTPTATPRPTATPQPTKIAPSIISRSLPASVNAGLEEILGQGEPGAVVEVLIDDSAVISTTVDESGYWSLEIDLPEGEHLIDVRSRLGELTLSAIDDPIAVMVLSPTPTSTSTVTNTPTPRPTVTSTATSTETPLPTATLTITPDRVATQAAAATSFAATETARPTQTPTVTKTPTLTPTNTATPTPAEPAAGAVREFGGIPFVYVPAGEFIMGSTDTDAEADGDEKPQHMVCLDAFWIMQTEVTNDMWQQFIDAEGYATEDLWSDDGWNWRIENGIEAPWDRQFAQYNGRDYPVVGISWYEAEAFASWLNHRLKRAMRLPTEAEWEKGARGSDGWKYPWGNVWDAAIVNHCDSNCDVVVDWKDENGDDGYGYTAPVNEYPGGTSPYGALNMAGNVWEWTADWYYDGYYGESPMYDPIGPENGTDNVVRGGAWISSPLDVRAANRSSLNPSLRRYGLGVRLVTPPNTVIGVAGSRGATVYDDLHGTMRSTLDIGTAMTVYGRSEDEKWVIVQTAHGVTGWVAVDDIVIFNISSLPITSEEGLPICESSE